MLPGVGTGLGMSIPPSRGLPPSAHRSLVGGNGSACDPHPPVTTIEPARAGVRGLMLVLGTASRWSVCRTFQAWLGTETKNLAGEFQASRQVGMYWGGVGGGEDEACQDGHLGSPREPVWQPLSPTPFLGQHTREKELWSGAGPEPMSRGPGCERPGGGRPEVLLLTLSRSGPTGQ